MFGAVALSRGIWFYSSWGYAWELPFWVGASDTQTQTKPQAPAANCCLCNSSGGQGGHCVLLGRHCSWHFAACWGPMGGTSTAGRGGAGGEGLSKGLPAFHPAFWEGYKVLFCHLVTYLSSFSKGIVPCGPLKDDFIEQHQLFTIRCSPERSRARGKSRLPLLRCLIYTAPRLHCATRAVIIAWCDLWQPWGCCQREVKQVGSRQG